MTHPTLTSPGWFGKLPGSGDFAHRRMPTVLRTHWDDWLHDGLGALKARHPRWMEAYLTSPVWGFMLGPGIAGDAAWIGAMAPSVDKVGRYYPIALFAPLTSGEMEPAPWWHAAHHLLMQALEDDADAHGFERLVATSFQPTTSSPAEGELLTTPLPGFRQTIWTHASNPLAEPPLQTSGLPSGPCFDLLFDLQAAATHLEDQP